MNRKLIELKNKIMTTKKIGYIPQKLQNEVTEELWFIIKEIEELSHKKYINLIKEVLNVLEDYNIINNKILNISEKKFLLEIKYNENCTLIKLEEKDVVMSIWDLLILNKLSLQRLIIKKIEILNGFLKLDTYIGTFFEPDKLNVQIKVGNEIYNAKKEKLIRNEKIIFNKSLKNYIRYSYVIPIKKNMFMTAEVEYCGIIRKLKIDVKKLNGIKYNKKLELRWIPKTFYVLKNTKYELILKKERIINILKSENELWNIYFKVKKNGYKNKIKNLLIMLKIVLVLIFIRVTNINFKKIWLICETDMTAQDNGYHFFKWLRKNDITDKKIYYVLNKNSKDYKKLKKLGNVVERLTFKHIFYLFLAEKHIGTHDYRQWNYPGNRFVFQRYFEKYISGKFIQLQHGIMHMKGERGFHYNPEQSNYDKVIVSSEWEKRLLHEYFGHPKEKLVITGLARYDNLLKRNKEKNQVFFMPTWRKQIRKRKLFIESEYYLRVKEILENENLINKLRKTQTELKFYLHIKLNNFIDLFESLENDVITIVKAGEEDIQNLLIESKLLITDYSSISFDHVYMKKPVIFYQYDYQEYIKSYRVENYQEYKADRFGEICYDKENLLEKIIDCIESEFKIKEEFLVKSNKYFKYRDNKNCQRIYDELTKENN